MLRKLIVLTALLWTLGACTKDFETINVNPNAPSAVPLDYLLAQSTLLITGEGGDPGYRSWRTNIIYASMMMQHLSSVEVGFYRGTVYTFQGDLSAAWFERAYPNSIKNLVNLIELAKQDPKNVNILSMARILRVIEMGVLTDVYGDVPYSEAGYGALTGTFSPKYDAQKDIYAGMLKELEEAGTALSTTAYIPKTADLVFGGDMTKWKRAANSLMLRFAMRMQKADAPAAQTWAKKATDRGLMASNDDSFSVKFANTGAGNNSNPNSWNMIGTGRGIVTADNIQWGKTFIEAMKTRKDPRLTVVSALKTGDRIAASQLGLPSGTDATMLATLPVNNRSLYSRPAPNMYALNNPQFVMTYAESELLKAEAIERTWATGTAKQAYDNALVAGIKQISSYGGTLTDADGATYLSSNPYPASGTLDAKLEAIHTEFWMVTGSLLNHIEAWSNWRRTGYPKLTPVNYPGNETNGQIPRRLRYSQSEYGVNPGIDVAISRQGADLFTTRMWWDK
ncbi:MAG: SusD/RagB family nutrient-binding outer membrane lipoprotein [Cytophagaceae bacterium]|nr:SusD/RagB family nutrient-binding outer membrane lipoprotein [Cytophagaceae bacterium]